MLTSENSTPTIVEKHFSTSKIILFIILVLSYILAGIIIYLSIAYQLEDVAAILGVIFAPACTVVTVYSIKAKKENELKIKIGAKQLGIKMSNEEDDFLDEEEDA